MLNSVALGDVTPDARVVRKTDARPEREPEAFLQVEERDGAVFEFRADDALRREAQTVAIEAHRTLEIVHAKREHRDPCLHGTPSFLRERFEGVASPSRCLGRGVDLPHGHHRACARYAAALSSAIIMRTASGTICQETPKRFFSQPHMLPHPDPPVCPFAGGHGS